ncbi:MAG: protein-L-isoaspartate(D-aspartate) O-methyltransferase [Planctomycetota bacterium]|nr:MAG: protein-L-isoaspartate(D-aspartate) O-methyltransferase [Planctomycetota bacterium]
MHPPRRSRPHTACRWTTRLLTIAALSVAAGFAGGAARSESDRFVQARREMVERYLIPEGIDNRRVLQAMLKVPRHLFVPVPHRQRAYFDMGLPIGYGQTISSPFIVAYMTQALDPQPTDRVLEIGTGSGYQAAVLAELVAEVYSVEIVEPLAKSAERRLKELGYRNAHVKAGDGYLGWPEHAPFDKIIVTCSPESVPRPLVEQLREGGRMIIPLGTRYQQVFHLLEKKNGRLQDKQLLPTLFVPMTGQAEKQRRVQPDPLHPRLVNGSFENDANGDRHPDGWHYQRQIELRSGDAAEGDRYVRLHCEDPQRTAQLLQGFPVDGRRIGRLRMRFSARVDGFRSTRGKPQGGVLVLFYDRIRKPAGELVAHYWFDTDGWERFSRSVSVPTATREAIIWIGIKSATGTVDLDAISLEPIPR